MEIGKQKGVYGFSSPGRLYGLLFMVRGQATVFGASRRGFFWRCRAKVFSPVTGYFDSVFGLKSEIGEVGFLLKTGLKDELVPVSFRCSWIRGSLFISRHGLHTFNLRAIDPEVFPQIPSKHSENFAELPVEDVNFYLDSGKREY